MSRKLFFAGEMEFNFSCSCAFVCLFGSPTTEKISKDEFGELRENSIKEACLENYCPFLRLDSYNLKEIKKLEWED